MAMENLTAEQFRNQFCRDGVAPKKHGLDSLDAPTRITIWLPRLPKQTHPNARCHWAAKAKAVKQQRLEAWDQAKPAMGLMKPWKAATVQVCYFTSASRIDRDGILSHCKASFDGLQGIVIGDDSAFTYLPVQVEKVKRGDSLQGCVRLTITPTGAK